jgi:tetratricopeptide (TPR) repeat protein
VELPERVAALDPLGADEACGRLPRMNAGADVGAIPAKVSENIRPTVTAGLAKDVELVNQYAAPMYAPTAAGAAAARWELRNGDVETALKYADKALEYGNSVNTLRTKAAVLDKKGDKAGAQALRDRAMAMANEAESIAFTVGPMMNAKKYDDAMKYLNDYLAAHPNSDNRWRIMTSIGDVYAAKGDAAKAMQMYEQAKSLAPDAADKEEVQDSINALGAGQA